MQTMSTHYLTPAETAAIVRRVLKREFPTVRFGVRSQSYSGGGSVNVTWTDGPRRSRVEAIAKQYEGNHFDGSIDMGYSSEHWLRADGSVFLAHDPGTAGSGGSVPSEDNRALARIMPEDAQLVHFGAFIFCDRRISNEESACSDAEQWIREHCHISAGQFRSTDMFGNRYVTELARSMARVREHGQSWQDVFDYFMSGGR